MNLIILTAIGILALPIFGTAQGTAVSTGCPTAAKVDANVVLVVCDNERGMVPWPQPRLYLRVFADGRGEIETNAPPSAGYASPWDTLIKRKLTAEKDEIEEIRRLGRMADLQAAKDIYPAYVHGTDSSTETTILFNDAERSKKIVVNNFAFGNFENRTRYGPSLIKLMKLVTDLHDRGLGIIHEPPNISFCELIKNRENYLGEVVSTTVVLEYGEKQQNIYDPECAEPNMGAFFSKERVGVGFDAKKGNVKDLERKALSLREARFGGHARVFITGVLVEDRERAADTYPFRFEIRKLENIDPIYLPYKGRLEPGWMYVDSFDATNDQYPVLSSPLKVLPHHAARIEWLNAARFPKLRTAGQTFITFRVISKDIKNIGNGRWNDTYVCEIMGIQ